MSNADDLRRLAEEVKSAYEVRVNFVSENKQGTANLLDTFDKDHEKMAKALRSDLAGFKSELDRSEKVRKSSDQAEISERKDYIDDLRDKAQEMVNEFDAAHEKMASALRSELTGFKSELDGSEKERKKADQAEVNQRRQDITNLLVEFDRAHEEMADALRSELSGFKSEMDGAEKARKSTDQAEISERKNYIDDLRKKAIEMVNEFDAAHEKMAKALRSELARIKPELKSVESDRKAGVHADMAAVQAEIKEMSSAWKELITTMQSVRGRTVITGKARVAAGKVTKTVEEAIEEPVEEAIEEPVEEAIEEPVEEAIEEKEQLRAKIINLVSDNPAGIKMTKIAEILDIENWRSLIPVMRELVDADELEKEGSLYFT